MINTETKSVTIDQTVRLNVICDRCGKDITWPKGEPHHGNIEGGWLTVDFGYGSKFDLNAWKAELCDDCSGELLKWMMSKGGSGMQGVGADILVLVGM